MRTIFTAKGWNDRRVLLRLLFATLVMLVTGLSGEAAAPSRGVPYVESICRTSPDVFFCEDFEGGDIDNRGNGNCGSTWGNPAIQNKDGSSPSNFCWAGGGSYQNDSIPLPSFSSNNRVWRVTKSTGFTDIVTGRNTGTGSGTLSGWFNPSILGSATRDWYTRIQVYFDPTHTWPAEYDFKMFYALPRDFVDAPSAVYETGIYFHQDFWCGSTYFPPSGQNFNDVPVIRYGNNFGQFPRQNEYCPPLNPGQAPNGSRAPRFVKGRWYTLEYHLKLSSSPTANDGVLELWVDGVKAYSTTRNTCAGGCPNMGFIYILGWMNSADPQSGYYEIDNVVMSRRYIGPPAGGAVGDTTPPAPPTNLTASPQ
jgi:hypothetical protein